MIQYQDHKELGWEAVPLSMSSWPLIGIAVLPLLNIDLVMHGWLVAQSWLTLGACHARLLCPWNWTWQEYWSVLPYPPPGDLPEPGIKPTPPALPGGFFNTEPSGKPLKQSCHTHKYKPGSEYSFDPVKHKQPLIIPKLCSLLLTTKIHRLWYMPADLTSKILGKKIQSLFSIPKSVGFFA